MTCADTVIWPDMLGITAVAAETEIERLAVPVPPEFLAESDTEYTPDVVGDPLIIPVEVLSVKPFGRPVAPKEVGDPEARIVYVKG